MKITLTYSEAQEIIAKHFNLPNYFPENILIEPSVGQIPVKMDYAEDIRQVMKEFPEFETSQKIAAIKKLKKLSGCGLAEAKFAIENPDTAIFHWATTGKVANPSYVASY